MPTPDIPDAILCHSRRLCYILPCRNEIEMLKLDTGERSVWTAGGAGGMGGSKRCLSVSDRYLVLASAES